MGVKPDLAPPFVESTRGRPFINQNPSALRE